MSNKLGFLKDFNKTLEKAGLEEGSAEPPRYWYSTGNYVANKVMAGSFLRGIPQGRVTGLVGPSGAGKSFMLCNIMREAQKAGATILTLDSENALDDEFVRAIGVDPDNDYMYVSVTTIPDVVKTVSAFIKGYKAEYGRDNDAPEVMIAIDSLDMLSTETEDDNFAKGVSKGDQGQRNKQLKAMLRQFVQAIKHYNIAIVVTGQVYENQDVMNGEGRWIVSGAIKYSLSQIAMLTKLKLKDTGSREVKGIRMKMEGYKTRFAKPYQTVTVEVPYDEGMDPYNGLLDVAVALDVVEKKGARYALKGEDKTWYAKDFGERAQQVLELCEAEREQFLDALVSDDEEVVEKQISSKQKRQDRASESEG